MMHEHISQERTSGHVDGLQGGTAEAFRINEARLQTALLHAESSYKQLERTQSQLRAIVDASQEAMLLLTPDGRPILGRDPLVSGLWYAVGHGRNGILLAALTGDVIGDLMIGKQLDFDLSPFLIDRFETPSAISRQQADR